jgi:quercetin dioxygenase-like cupin family protein
MDIIKAEDVKTFSFSGVSSRQLLFPENSTSQRITITRVVVQPGASNPPHRHATSEQVWPVSFHIHDSPGAGCHSQ